MSRRLSTILAVIVLLVVASMVLFLARTRQIPFDSAGLRGGDARLRFRMKDSLEAQYHAGELATREIVDAILGPDDDRMGVSEVRQFRLMEWDGNPWDLRIRFDNRGQVIDLGAHAS